MRGCSCLAPAMLSVVLQVALSQDRTGSSCGQTDRTPSMPTAIYKADLSQYLEVLELV